MLAVALKRQCAIAIDATRQADTFGAVCSCPAHLTGAAVGFCAVALAWDAVWVADGVLAVVGLVRVTRHASHLPTLVTNVVIILLKLKGDWLLQCCHFLGFFHNLDYPPASEASREVANSTERKICIPPYILSKNLSFCLS